MVEIDEEGRCFLVESVTGENGQSYTKATFLMAVTPDGQVVYDGGRVQWVHPFPYRAGAGEIRNGKLQVPGSRQLPQVAMPKKVRYEPRSLVQDPRRLRRGFWPSRAAKGANHESD